MTIQTEDQLDGLRSAGHVVSEVLRRMCHAAEPGMTTAELDALGANWLAEADAESAPRVTYGFPGATCISVNEEIAHGVPGVRRLSAGDMVNIDVSARVGGYFADTGASFTLPPDVPLKKRVRTATFAALDAAIHEVRPGARLSRIGHAMPRMLAMAGPWWVPRAVLPHNTSTHSLWGRMGPSFSRICVAFPSFANAKQAHLTKCICTHRMPAHGTLFSLDVL